MSGFSLTDRENLWIQAGGDPSKAALAGAVSLAENTAGDPTIVSPTDDVGLWQINMPAHPEYSLAFLQDPFNNAKAAVAISKNGSNWNPWTTYKSGAYKQYLTGDEVSLQASNCQHPINLPGIDIFGHKVLSSSICMDSPLGVIVVVFGFSLVLIGATLLVAYATNTQNAVSTAVSSFVRIK